MVWVWIWKISPKNDKFFSLGSKKSLRVGSESTQVEGGLASYLLLVKSKLGSGRVRAHVYFVHHYSRNTKVQLQEELLNVCLSFVSHGKNIVHVALQFLHYRQVLLNLFLFLRHFWCCLSFECKWTKVDSFYIQDRNGGDMLKSKCKYTEKILFGLSFLYKYNRKRWHWLAILIHRNSMSSMSIL